jgi:2-polyprenyl-3-methyl-5-hydroxy-6-metoxy-1,4-benzoquinol methylase
MKRPTVQLELRPMADDPGDAGLDGKRRLWRATTIDPIFVATAPGGGRIARGWYTATARIEARAGEIAAPCFYLPSTTGHYSEERRVELAPRGREWVSQRFFLERSMPRLRFDPSCRPSEFTCEVWLDPAPEPVRARAARWMADLRALRSRAPVASARPPSRRKRVLSNISKRGLGVEIGPSIDPIAPKREGYRVHIIDHVDRQALIAKYIDDPVELDLIEEVDFVWRGESYLELTGRPKQYDWIIASHVIEHTPDLVAFLVDCDSILKDDGVLSLVIPDKRYVFDRFRPVTGLARVVDAHVTGRREPSAGAVAEHHLYAVLKGRLLGWWQDAPGDYSAIHTTADTRALLDDPSGAYKDVHNWCFVPHSFRLLVEDLHALGYTRFREVSFHPTEGCEFYVTLGRRGAGPGVPRDELLRAVERELAPPEAG